jgi:opacity protein-like surface antigen
MNTRNTLLAVAIAAALALPAAASARELDFNYIEAQFINVDVDLSESDTIEGELVTVKTDSDNGFQIGGAWEVWESVHLFAEYSTAGQDIKGSAFGITVKIDDFDVERWRIGMGYAYPTSSVLSLYGRISYDSIKFKNLPEYDEETLEKSGEFSTKDDGVGAELGLLWAAMPQLHVQPFVRYTSVGEVDLEEEDKFNSDFLFGVGARWFLTDNFAVQAGYEAGEINTWSIGLRMAF